MMIYKELTIDDVDISMFACFDRTQNVTKCWRKIDGEWVIKDIVFVDNWSDEEYRKGVDYLRNLIQSKGYVVGAFLDGKLKGWLGFFDAAIIEPKPFESVDDVLRIKLAGGGGTDFQIIFEYVHQHMENKLPACIIILTDGYAPFPQEHLARDIPVLWLIDNSDVEPPWGKVARIKV